jgi:hypothetical protein
VRRRRLYVSHATHVAVVDVDSGKVVGDIPDTPGVHGIAIAPELNRGFVSNGRGNNVTIFDLKTLKAIGSGSDRRESRFDSLRRRVGPRSSPSTGGRTTQRPSTQRPARSRERSRLAESPSSRLPMARAACLPTSRTPAKSVVIDTAKLTVTKRYSLSPCQEPSGLAIDAKNRKLFSVCGNRIMAISDPDTGKVVATPAIGAGSDGCAFDPGTGYAFSSNGDGTMTIVQQTAGKWEVAENIATERGAARLRSMKKPIACSCRPLARRQARAPAARHTCRTRSRFLSSANRFEWPRYDER